jgi:hypothetical protein
VKGGVSADLRKIFSVILYYLPFSIMGASSVDGLAQKVTFVIIFSDLSHLGMRYTSS